MKSNKKGQSVQDLIGIKSFTDYGLDTVHGELIFYAIAPTNISVLSKTNIEVKIRHLMMTLSAVPEMEIVCTDASECFDDNKNYMMERKKAEDNPNVRKIISHDIAFLDRVQSEMATARQFVMTVRIRNAKPEQVFQTANRVEKIITDQGFDTHRLKKNDIKRLLALYFDASYSGEQMPDQDGEQYIGYMSLETVQEHPIEYNPNAEPAERKNAVPKSALVTEKVDDDGSIFGTGFGGYVRTPDDDED